jgi:hypothetical protein
MKRIVAAMLLVALSASPVSAQSFRQYRCNNSTVLRVIFDDEARTATVVPFARPSIRLSRAPAHGSGFRYLRRDTHELRGTREQVIWRVGRAQWTCRRNSN